jgi:hypothetical protein
LPNNYGHLVNVEDVFHSCPNILGSLEISSAWNFLGSLGIFLLDNFGQIVKAKKWFCGCPPSQVLSHMKVSVLGKTTLEALVNMMMYFNPLESRGQTNLLGLQH